MQGITNKSVKLLSRSGLVLLLFSMLGSFALAAVRVSGGMGAETWADLFNLLFIAILGIATYYLAMSAFTWIMVSKKDPKSTSI